MNILFWGITLGTIGKIMAIVGVLFAHMKLAKERKVDNAVVHSLHTEKILTIVGLVFILIGYVCEVYFYGLTTTFLSCEGTECTGAVLNAFGNTGS
jgi:Na+/H+-translocating membrane pyrophosphatase